MTLSEWIADTSHKLNEAGIEYARPEIYLWLTQMTDKNRAWLSLHAKEPMNVLFSSDLLAKLQEITTRRISREPLAYILGTTFFYGYPFQVGPGVLIPRSDSEIAVEIALAVLGLEDMPASQYCNQEIETDFGATPYTGTLRFVDVCTGSGCLAIAISEKLRERKVAFQALLTDISPEALSYARRNRDNFALSSHLDLRECDLFPDQSTFASIFSGEKANLIISNPPYVRQDEMNSLMPEVRDFEPEMALTDRKMGLSFYERILSESSHYLACDGVIIFEHGYEQAEAVSKLCREHGFDRTQCFRDYGGQPRVTMARKSV